MGEESEKRSNKVGIVATVSKKPRHRKKQLYQGLKRQMEFYFSDVNIYKDRFMNQLLQNSSCVDLSVFLTFNRIKAMTSNIKDIANALQTSELLKVTDCGTKVFRIVPPQEKNNSDNCTIYVEQLPPEADHNWLTDIFQVYGPIDYVSIPKFKHSQKIKGFAFVEFKDEQSAKNAITAFSEMGCCISKQMDPGNLFSIKTFEENENEIINAKPASCVADDKNKIDGSENDTVVSRKDSTNSEDCTDQPDKNKNSNVSRKRKKSLSKSEDGTGDCKRRTNSECETESNVINKHKSVNIEEGKNQHLKHKRKLSESNSEAAQSDSEIPTKTVKLDRDNKLSIDDLSSTENNSNKDVTDDNAGCNEVSCDENVGEETAEYTENDEERRNRNRKRRKKNKKNKGTGNTYNLQILSKLEWKSLRNKYLNEQRKKMKEFKQYVRKYDNNRYRNTEQTRTKEHNDDNVQENGNEDVQKESIEVSNRLTLSPGLIVKVTLNEPIISKSSFKNEAKIFPEIKYIDIVDSSNIAFVRFSSPSAAENCIKSGHWKNAEIIKGKEEKSYWDKIVAEREEKLSKGRPVKKGRDKLLKKAEKMHEQHIWFD